MRDLGTKHTCVSSSDGALSVSNLTVVHLDHLRRFGSRQIPFKRMIPWQAFHVPVSSYPCQAPSFLDPGALYTV